MVGAGGLKRVPDDFVRDYVLAWPPAAERQRIVAFLDRETAKIDALVEEQRRLIELLKEKRQAVISHAVTKGLDPSTPMKESGIEWLGQVPAHWIVARIKDVCSEIVDCKNRTPDAVEQSRYFVIRTSCIRQGVFDPKGGYFTSRDDFEEWTRKGLPRHGDVLFTREAPAGEACLVPADLLCCLGQRMMFLRPDRGAIEPEYLLAAIYGPTVRRHIEANAKGSTVSHLRVGEVGELPLLVPPLEEQQQIIERLQSLSRLESGLIAEADRSIQLATERRAALISAAVTGKIDVREPAAAKADLELA